MDERRVSGAPLLFGTDRRRRRTPWLILGSVGAIAVVGAGVWLWRLAQTPSAELPSMVVAVMGLFIGAAQVVVALLQLPRTKGVVAVSDQSGPLRPGMVSLAPPEGLLESRVRGRDELIEELARLALRRSRREPGVHVLHGTGGSGKTTVALAVARRAAARGVTVWWISAASVNAMETGLRQLLRHLGASDQELRREWTEGGPDLLWRRLGNFSARWLLIIDNADDTQVLSPAGETVAAQRGWIRPVRSRRGMIMVTSRDGEAATWGAAREGHRWCVMHHVAMLSNADSAQVLLDRAGGSAGSLAEATLLGARLGGLPLALRLAGAYLADTNRLPLPGAIKTFSGYREALDAGRLAALFEAGAQPLREDAARGIIYRTWELSLDLLRQRDLGQARPLLRLLAMFADAPIPYRLVLNPVILARAPMLVGLEPAGLRRLLYGLADLSLIDIATAEVDSAMPTLRLHPLIRDTCRHHLALAGDTGTFLATTVRLLSYATGTGQTGPPDDPHSWPNWAALSPHVLRIFQSVLETPADAEVERYACQATTEVARYLAESGQYAAARDAYHSLVPVGVGVYGATHVNVLTLRANLALWTGHAGDAAAARGQFAALTATMDGLFGPDHSATLAVKANLADWMGHSGGATAACTQFAELQAQYERILGAEHPDTLAIRANLAWWTGVAGHAAAARDQFAALLPLRRRVLGAEHPGTLTASANLALWTGAAGDVGAALSQYSALLPVFVKVFGAEHPSTLSVRANLARWTGNAGNAAAALEMYRELRPTVERILGATHPGALVLRANIALWTGAAGDSAGARRQFADLLPERLRVSGPEHPSTLVVRANLAYWTIESGELVAAAEQTALLALLERVLGTGHPTTVTLRARFGRPDSEPPPPYNALIPIVERITGAEHPRTMMLGDTMPARRS